ncbi:hypothetical protein NUACC21_18040 [Scytonema sp. NUACC21]
MFETTSVKVPLYSPNPEKPQLSREIRRLERDVLRMGALVEQSFRLSHQALFTRNLTVAEELPILDKQIDCFYRQIESDCAAIMTQLSPTAQDLRCLSAFMHKSEKMK